eukprot:TRINITY_DN14219_c0_g3_i2.p1 TRINITY_DN14219_c0_g3~~TRINITY_DN14219_c0_g3_i2.p1  ORF type:complete len:473 (-),score=82.28 TRINITY_DN14219_c0_g3_i2:91-1509(-)
MSRSFGKFLADQNVFLKKKRSLIEVANVISERIPKIDGMSAMLATKRNRSGSIHKHLYNNSKKSILTNEETPEKLKKSVNENRMLKVKANTIMIQGFNKEFQRVLEESNLNYQSTITFPEMLLVLEKMRLIKTMDNNPKELRDLVHKLWLDIKLPKEDITSVETLKFYIAAILNIEHTSSEPKAKINRVAQEFAPLYWNRQTNKQKREVICEYSFKPILCKESLVIAEELKRKCEGKLKGALMSKDGSKLNKVFSSECTFRPKINAYKRPVHTSRLQKKANQPCSANLKRAECKSTKALKNSLEEQKTELIKTKMPVSSMRSKSRQEESYKVKDIIKNAVETAKEIKQRGQPMNNHKEQTKKLEDNAESKLWHKETNSRPETQNNRPSLIDKEQESENDLEVLLYIDVTYKGSKKRIVVRNGDTAKEVTERFALENGTCSCVTSIGIDEKKKARLEKMVSAHIRLLVQNNEQ